MGTGSSNSLLNTVYFYNGKLFGLHGGEHRNITVRNIRVSDDCLRFEKKTAQRVSMTVFVISSTFLVL